MSRAARLSNSSRLQQVHNLLKSGQEYSTLDIIHLAGVCAVNSCITELRVNGATIACRREGDTWLYRMSAPCPQEDAPNVTRH